jgi:membrane-associated protein
VNFLTGLHGSIATVLICVLLYIDEAGVPLPLCPNEFLLIVAGLLVASGAVSIYIFLPAAILAMVLGTLTGYTWARQLGSTQLQALANKVRAGKPFARATSRMRDTSSRQIFVARMIPGIRAYITLIAGTVDVTLSTFMRGSVPAIVVWATFMTFLGYFVGIPAVHFLTAVEQLALSGGILLALGIIGYRSATRASGPGAVRRHTFTSVARRDRFWLAGIIDFGVVATIAAGIDRLTRSVGIRVHAPFSPPNGGLIDVLTVVAAVALCYLILSRRIANGNTAGERLFDVSYVRLRSKRPAP